MDIEEAQRRDRIWRNFFAGVDWDRGEEFALTRQLVLDENNALAPWPYLVDWEWEVVPGASNLGRGDLLFTDGEREYAVVEVKYIDKDSSGPTARTRRKTKRGKVARQANRLMHRKASQNGKTASYVSTSSWRLLRDVIEQWSSEQAEAGIARDMIQVNQTLTNANTSDSVRAVLRELTPGLESSVRHDLSQLATAINSAAENILDIQYGDVKSALGWTRPKPQSSYDRKEVWKREKAIFYFSELLNVRLALGPGLPDEATLRERTQVSVHGMFLKIVEPYRLLAKDRGIRLSVEGTSYGKTLAPYEAFLIPPLAVIDNAVKYAPQNTEIVVGFHETSDTISVEVISVGPRLDPDEHREIFRVGFRGRNAEGVAEGQGLGLWLAATLLDGWGGRIAVDQESAPEKASGAFRTTFVLQYPRCR